MELRVIRHGVVDSTSERAFAAIVEGTARDGDVHVASGQTAGRGRRGATWHSPEGEGLYLSVVLAPEAGRTPPEAPSMAGALAVRDALRGLGVRDVQLKWPNDLLVDGAKMCGVLVESRGFDPAEPRMVLGIGIDVSQGEFPPELLAERAVTSLALTGIEATPREVLERLLPHLAVRIEASRRDPELLAADYVEASGLLGRRVRIEDGGPGVEGVLSGLTLAAGATVERSAGRVTVPLGHVRTMVAATRENPSG